MKKVNETQEDLKKYLKNKRWIERNIDEIQEIEDDKMKANKLVASLSGMPSGTASNDRIATVLANVLDQEKSNLANEFFQKREKQIEIKNKILNIDEPYQTILYDKYIKGKSLNDISEQSDRNYQYICRLHGLALLKYADEK